MSDAALVAVPILPDSPESLRLERDEILARRKRYNQGSFALGIPALILLMMGIFNFVISLEQAVTPTWSTVSAASRWLGAGLFCGAGVYVALYRGRHPAWGFLSVISLFLLLLLRDRNAQRLVELEQRLGNQIAARRLRSMPFWPAWALPFAPPFAFFGLIYGLLYLRRAQVERRSLVAPLLACVWAGVVTGLFVALVMNLVNGDDHSRKSPVAGQPLRDFVQGRFARATLLSGWQEIPEMKQQPGIDLGVGNVAEDLYLAVAVVSKEDVRGGSLLVFSAALMQQTSSLDAFQLVYGPRQSGEGQVEYRFKASADKQSMLSYLKCFKEVDGCYLVLTAFAIPSRMTQNEAILRRAMAGVELLPRR